MKRHAPLLLLVFSVVACAKTGGGHGHAHDESGHGHGHGHDGASEAVTRWGETTQLFVEFPALVVDEASAFAAHFTRLADHQPIAEGTVVVELTAAGTTERFSVEAPTVPGIFRPEVTPTRLGPHTVVITLSGARDNERHELGTFTVFPSRSQADAAAEEEDAGDEIGYLLEQQWKVPFHLEAVEARPMRPNVTAFARLTLPNDAEATVRAPKSGRLVSAAGHFPKAGQVTRGGERLFTLSLAPTGGADPASLDLAVDRATIQVEAAQREVDRLAPLVTQGVVAQRRLDDAKSALSQAEAALRSATRRRNNLGQSQRVGGRGEDLPVPAPIGGAVTEVFVAPGAWVTEGEPLARVVSRERLWLDVGVPEAYLPELGSVSGAWFRLDAVEKTFELGPDALVSVGAEVDAAARTLPVRFVVDNADGRLFAGMTTLAHLIIDTPRTVPAVPMTTIIDDGGTDVVYVQTGGEAFVRRPVRLGIVDGTFVELTAGVSPGDWVVTRGGWQVRLAAQDPGAIGHGHAH